MNNLFDNNLFDMETEPQYEPLAEPQAPCPKILFLIDA
jgi:hypothetical protein